MSTLERAIAIAAAAHAGAADKGGEPYILHPLRVMLAVSSTEERIVAVLHDVVEDTGWTVDELRREGFSETVLRAIEAVTRRPGEDYLAFVRRAGTDTVGRVVKLADLHDNLDGSRIPSPTERDRARGDRYRAAVALLENEAAGTAAPEVGD